MITHQATEKKTKSKWVGQAGTQFHTIFTLPQVWQPTTGRELKPRASSRVVKSSNSTSDTSPFKTLVERWAPKTSNFENQRGSCLRPTIQQPSKKCLLKGPLIRTDSPQGPVQSQRITSRLKIKEAHLLIWKTWPKGQASNLTHTSLYVYIYLLLEGFQLWWINA